MRNKEDRNRQLSLFGFPEAEVEMKIKKIES